MGLWLNKTAASPCWSDLPPDIAGEILSRLPTDDDRLNFKTVCREWHLAARQQRSLLPPAVPCINLGKGMYQSIVTGDNDIKVYSRRFATPTGLQVTATFGCWLLCNHTPSGQYFLYKPLSPSTAAIKVPCRHEESLSGVTGNYNPQAIMVLKHWLFLLRKILVCSSHLVAALAGNALLIDARVGSSYFSPKTTNLLLTTNFTYKDIAFHHGKIFAVSSTEHLFSHWLAREGPSQNQTGPMEDLYSYWSSGETSYQIQTEYVIKEQPSAVAADDNYYHHLVTSVNNQKLLMVRWGIPQESNQTMSLQVFEADLDNGRWSQVNDLGREVLFVGLTGSRAFLAEGSSEHYYGRKFQGGNRVFILGHDWESARRLAADTPCRYLEGQKLANDIPSYCVYDMATGKSSLVGHHSKESFKAEWLFSSG